MGNPLLNRNHSRAVLLGDLYNGGNSDDSCELLQAKLATLREALPNEQESSGGKLRGYPPRNGDSRPPAIIRVG